MAPRKLSVDNNNLVWAKMKGYPPWPGKVCEPPSEIKPRPGHEWIYFFGTKNYGWIEKDKLYVYEDHKETIQKSIKSSGVQAAIKEIESYKKGQYVLSPIAPTKSSKKDKKEPKTPDSSKPSTSDSNKSKLSDKSKPKVLDLNEAGISVSNKARKSEPNKPRLSDYKPRLSDYKPRLSDYNKPRLSDYNKPRISDSIKPRLSDYNKRKISDANKPSKKILVDGSNKRTSSASARSSPKDIVKRTTITPVKSPRKPKDQQEKQHTPVKEEKVIRKRTSSTTIEPKLKKKSITPKRDTEKSSPSLTPTPETLQQKNIELSTSHIGIVGLGKIGSNLLKIIIQSGRKVIIWDNKTEKCNAFQDAGAEVAMTPNDVFSVAPITFCCVEDYDSLETIVCVNRAYTNVKKKDAFVVIDDFDFNRSLAIEDCVRSFNGGRYLEVRFLGSSSEADRESLSIVAAGDRDVYDDCLNLFQLISSYIVFVGEVGKASKYHAVMQAILGYVLGGISEALDLAKKYEVNGTHLLESLEYSPFNCPLIESKIKADYNLDYTSSFNFSNFKKGLKESVDLSEYVDIRLAGTSCAHSISSCHNEMRKSI